MSYSFDAFGNRLQRQATSGSTTTTERFAYDGWDTAKPGAIGSENFDVYADLNSSNSVTNRRLFGPSFDEPIARQDSSGVVAWYGTDQLGSVRTVFDNSGTVTGTRSYSGFGEITSETGTGLDRYAYTAREWDGVAGLQYSRARMYDPKIGRWTSEDPIGFGGGDSNLHRYVGNNATGATDPSGLARVPNPGHVAERTIDDGGLSAPGANEDGFLDRVWGWGKRTGTNLFYLTTPGMILLGKQMAQGVVDGNAVDRKIAQKKGLTEPSLLQTAAEHNAMYARAGYEGLKTGGKVGVNIASDMAVSTFTLGFYRDGTIFTPTQDDIDAGYHDSYIFSRVSAEVALFFATLGAGTAARSPSYFGAAVNVVGHAMKIANRGNAVGSVIRGVTDIAKNGLTAGNILETGLGILGMKGMAGRFSDGKLNNYLSNLIHTKLGNSLFHKPLSMVGNFLGFKVCFAAGTPIRTPGGCKAIDELAVGDLVLSRDEHNCEAAVEAKPVEEVFVREGLLWELRVGGQVIKTTAEHPFFVLNKGWTAANLLQVGDGILTEAGHWQAVEGIRDTGEWTTVYNVCVADWHTYFVGNDSWGFGLWAHNADYIKNADGTYSIILKYKYGWNDLHKKMARIKLYMINEVLPQIKTSVTPRIGTAQKEAAKNMKLKGTGFDADHIIDLQLGGKDVLSNIWPLLRSVNRSLGPQIEDALSKIPAGGIIKNIIIKGCSN